MPELPEVETIVRELQSHIIGLSIMGMISDQQFLDNLLETDWERFYKGTASQSITSVLRKGKYIIITLSNNNALVFHLGMTGKLWLYTSPWGELLDQLTEGGDSGLDKHTHLALVLVAEEAELRDDEDNLELHFNDVRLFGKVWLVEDVKDINNLDVPGLKDLGPDALEISVSQFSKLMRSKSSVKSILLNQSKIAGIGNIYVDEACFYAGIHPATRGIDLKEVKCSKLRLAVRTVLKQGIKYKGSSTSDYTTTDGSRGSYQDHHRVYQKTGKKCSECSCLIERTKIVGRSTHFCPSCQVEGE